MPENIHPYVQETRRVLIENLIRLPAPVADEVRDRIDAALNKNDLGAIQGEASLWSGIPSVSEAIENLAEAIGGAPAGEKS